MAASRFNSPADLGFGFSRPSSPKGTSIHDLVRQRTLNNLPVDLGEDGWGAMDTLSSLSSSTLWGSPQPPSRALTPQPQTHTSARKSSGMPSKPTAISPVSSSRPTPISLSPPLPSDPEPVPKSVVGMSKEERASEIARRREERRLVRVFLRASTR